jgi:hypothetical protein
LVEVPVWVRARPAGSVNAADPVTIGPRSSPGPRSARRWMPSSGRRYNGNQLIPLNPVVAHSCVADPKFGVDLPLRRRRVQEHRADIGITIVNNQLKIV